MENPLSEHIKIDGHGFKFYSLDQRRTWSSSLRSIVAYSRQKTLLSLELRKRFQLMDKLQDPDPDNFYWDSKEPHSGIGENHA